MRERFRDRDEGDLYMIQMWHELVEPEDHIWHLGDVCMERGNHMRHRFIGTIHSLPGHKGLVLGNHDHYDVSVYREAGFQKVKGSHSIDRVLMTHYPVHPGSLGFKTIGNAHGHIHEKPSPPGAYFNCSVENIGYQPIPFEEVRDELKRLKEKQS